MYLLKTQKKLRQVLCMAEGVSGGVLAVSKVAKPPANEGMALAYRVYEG